MSIGLDHSIEMIIHLGRNPVNGGIPLSDKISILIDISIIGVVLFKERAFEMFVV